MIGALVTWRDGLARGRVLAVDVATQTAEVEAADGVWTVAIEDLRPV